MRRCCSARRKFAPGISSSAILKSVELRRALIGVSQEFAKIPVDEVAAGQGAIWAGSDEGNLRPMDGSGVAAAGAEGATAAPGAKGTTALDRFSQDLTAKAKAGEMDPVLGREDEVRQVIDVLMRRRQNNPILTGEAGVGKTAVVEGFAQRIASGDVPPPLKGVKLCVLDVGLMQAGASMKGEFEQRLRSVIDEVQSSPTPIILFIDEAHTLIGAGGQAGTGDAANLLKPALARGTLRTIAATTWSEYRQYIEKDPALTRRFQPIMVNEPDVATAAIMLRGLIAPMEKHHKVRVTDEAIVAAVNLSNRYIPARQLPDKAVSLLDTACARVAISQNAKPAAVEDAEVEIDSLESEKESLHTRAGPRRRQGRSRRRDRHETRERARKTRRAGSRLGQGARFGRGSARAARDNCEGVSDPARTRGGCAIRACRSAAAARRRAGAALPSAKPEANRSRTARPCAAKWTNSARSIRKSG